MKMKGQVEDDRDKQADSLTVTSTEPCSEWRQKMSVNLKCSLGGYFQEKMKSRKTISEAKRIILHARSEVGAGVSACRLVSCRLLVLRRLKIFTVEWTFQRNGWSWCVAIRTQDLITMEKTNGERCGIKPLVVFVSARCLLRKNGQVCPRMLLSIWTAGSAC